MKLNNRGWGTIEMLLLSGGLLLALLVSAFFISKMYGSFEKSINDNNNYINPEKIAEEAAEKYILDNNISINDVYTVSIATLQDNGYITELVDNDSNICNGYVFVSNINSKLYYDASLTCF